MKESMRRYIIGRGHTYVEWWPNDMKMSGWCRDIYDGRWVAFDEKGRSKPYLDME